MPYDLTEMKQTLDLVPPFNPSKQSGVIQFATQPEENEEDNFRSCNGGGFDDNDSEAASHAASLKSRAKKEKKKAIERIFQNYRGSEEEKKDVIKYYKSNKMLNAMWVLDLTEAFMSREERKTKVSDFEDLAGFLSESEFYYCKETAKAPSFSSPVNQLCSNSIRKTNLHVKLYSGVSI